MSRHPDWAISTELLIFRVLAEHEGRIQRQEEVMATLQQAVQDIADAAMALEGEVATLQAALAAAPTPDPTIQASADKLEEIAAAMKAALPTMQAAPAASPAAPATAPLDPSSPPSDAAGATPTA